ncbi:MAG: hypothetical protein U1E76_17835 [Planctomycetota bacterium]
MLDDDAKKQIAKAARAAFREIEAAINEFEYVSVYWPDVDSVREILQDLKRCQSAASRVAREHDPLPPHGKPENNFL